MFTVNGDRNAFMPMFTGVERLQPSGADDCGSWRKQSLIESRRGSTRRQVAALRRCWERVVWAPGVRLDSTIGGRHKTRIGVDCGRRSGCR